MHVKNKSEYKQHTSNQTCMIISMLIFGQSAGIRMMLQVLLNCQLFGLVLHLIPNLHPK